jgi:hypothetical protein
VSVESSKLKGMTDHITIKATHTGLPRHADAIRQTIAFLSEGHFNASGEWPQPTRQWPLAFPGQREHGASIENDSRLRT